MGFKESVKNFVGKVGDTVDKGITKGVDSYNQMSEKNRVKKDMNRLNTELNGIFISVGKKLYGDEPENEKFATAFAEIKAKEDELKELTEQLNLLEGAYACPTCGETVHKGDQACPKCGALLGQKNESNSIEGETYCSNCGKKLDADAKFCDRCGEKIEEEVEAETVETEIYCSKCGKKLEAGAKFCDQCGEQIQ